MEAKARELGVERYTYRDLATDSNSHFTTIEKVMNGKRKPSRDMVIAWGEALAPHFPTDRALMSLGYMPVDTGIRALIERSIAAGGEGIRRALLVIDEQLHGAPPSEHGEARADHDADSQRGQQGSDRAQRA